MFHFLDFLEIYSNISACSLQRLSKPLHMVNASCTSCSADSVYTIAKRSGGPSNNVALLNLRVKVPTSGSDIIGEPQEQFHRDVLLIVTKGTYLVLLDSDVTQVKSVAGTASVSLIISPSQVHACQMCLLSSP